MTTILRIDASARTDASVSRGLADRIEAKLDGTVTRRDVGQATLPHVTGTWVASNFTPADERDADARAALALSDELVAELQAADTILISSPIYNFSIPASLKAWIDLVCRAGLTFKYTESGPVGLLENKRVIVAMASGGTEVGSDIDYASPYLRHVLKFIGLTDVTFVAADQMGARGDEAVEAARAQIDALAA